MFRSLLDQSIPLTKDGVRLFFDPDVAEKVKTVSAEIRTIVLDRVGATILYDEAFTPSVDLLEESGSLNNPEILAEHAARLDFYEIAPRLPYEAPTVIPYPSSLQWGQPYLYRVVLRTRANVGRCVTVIE